MTDGSIVEIGINCPSEARLMLKVRPATLSTRAALCFGPALRKRRRARPPCAPQARPVHTRQRATGTRTLPACLLCVVVLCHTSTDMQPSSAAHWGIGRRETRVRPADCVHPCTLLARLLPLCCLSLHCCPPLHLLLPLVLTVTKQKL